MPAHIGTGQLQKESAVNKFFDSALHFKSKFSHGVCWNWHFCGDCIDAVNIGQSPLPDNFAAVVKTFAPRCVTLPDIEIEKLTAGAAAQMNFVRSVRKSAMKASLVAREIGEEF